MIDDKTIQKLITDLLNIETSEIIKIDSVHTDISMKILVYLQSDDLRKCRVCGSKLIKNGFYSRKLNIPYSPFENIEVHLKINRKRCPSCNRSYNRNYHIFPDNKSLSYSMIQKIMDLLKNPSITFKTAAEIMNVSQATVMRTFDAHCHIPRIHLPEALCIDEIYTKNNSYKSKYSCIFYDFYRQSVVEVLPCRRKNYLASYLTKIPLEERNKVKFVCIDLYKPYKDTVSLYLKKATICADSFHVIKHLNEALDKVRIRLYKKYDSGSIEYYLLKQFKFLLFDRTIDIDNKGRFNKKLNRFINYRGLLELMLSIDKDLEEGFRLKELYSNFNQKFGYEEARDYMDTIIDEFLKADIHEFEEFTALISNWKQEIINSFIVYKERRLNNGIAESINESIALLIYTTKGIRDADRRRKRIIYSVNKEGFMIK